MDTARPLAWQPSCPRFIARPRRRDLSSPSWSSVCSPQGRAPNLTHTGESGLGKSTLIHTLFLQEAEKHESMDKEFIPAIDRVEKTVHITPHVIRLNEHGVSLTLTLVDTPGFGDAVNNEHVYVCVPCVRCMLCLSELSAHACVDMCRFVSIPTPPPPLITLQVGSHCALCGQCLHVLSER